MYPYQDSTRPIEERIDDLLARMTTEEKIMQTDLYSNSDFCTVDKNGRLTEIDFDKIDRLLKGRSAGCVQLRSMTAAQANEVQRMRTWLEETVALHTKQDVEKVRKDIERDKILTAQQALEYGLIDQVLEPRKVTASRGLPTV